MDEQELKEKLARLERFEKAHQQKLLKGRKAAQERHKEKVKAGLKRVALYVPAAVCENLRKQGKVACGVIWATPELQPLLQAKGVEAVKGGEGEGVELRFVS